MKIPETLKKDFESWQTTSAGIATILFGLFHGIYIPLMDGDPSTGVAWDIITVTVSIGAAAIFARDATKTDATKTDDATKKD